MGTLQDFTGQLVFFLHILMQIRTSGFKYIYMIWCIGIKRCIKIVYYCCEFCWFRGYRFVALNSKYLFTPALLEPFNPMNEHVRGRSKCTLLYL